MRTARKWLFIAIAVVLAIALVKDIALISAGAYRLNGDARVVAEAGAAFAARNRGTPKSGWPATYFAAQGRGITVTGFAQGDERVIIEVTAPVIGTWIIGPVLAIVQRKPMSTPMTVTSHADVLY